MLSPALFALALALSAPAEVAAQEQETFVINLREAEINDLAEQVSEITGRTLILDPSLEERVTVVSAEPMDRDGIWALFQSILSVRGYTAVRAGAVWEVIPEDQARSKGAEFNDVDPGTQDFVTRLLRLGRLSSEEAVRVLTPLVAEAGYIVSLSDPNAVVITDTAANVERLTKIAATLDADAEVKTAVIRFRFARAENVSQAITTVLGDAIGARLSVDPNTNLLLVRGSPSDIEQVSILAESLDIAPLSNPIASLRTQVLRLKHGDAEVIAKTVNAILRGGKDLSLPAPAPAQDTAASDDEDTSEPTPPVIVSPIVDVSVQPSSETNSIIVRGTERQIAEVGALVNELDVRRVQVMIEAAIVEVAGEAADRLGVQLGFGDAAPPNGIAATSFRNGGASLEAILVALGAPGNSVLSTGLSIGVGTSDFGAVVNALASSTSAKLLSTPSITTMDNQSATIVVGQNVPFRTGEFSTEDARGPVATIERQDVGITMKVVPRVTAGGVVRLEIEQEVSSISDAAIEGAADLITNKRVIQTTVLASDGGTVVLGGLISDDDVSAEGKVPVLGDVPVLGELFKSRNSSETRRTLFVFMRPKILHNQHQATEEALSNYAEVRAAEANLERTPPVYLGQPVSKLPLEIDGLY